MTDFDFFKYLTPLFISILIPLMANARMKSCLEKYGDSYQFQTGLHALKDGYFDSAQSFLNEEIKQHPDNGLAYYYLALISYKKDDLNSFFSNIQKAKECLSGRKNKVDFASTLHAEGHVLSEMGYYDKALHLFEQANKKDPDNPEYLREMSDMHYNLEKYKEGYKLSERIIKQFPDSPIGYYVNAFYNFIFDNWGETSLMVSKALERDPQYAEAYKLRGVMHLEREEWENAFDDLFNAVLYGENSAMNCICDIKDVAVPSLEQFVAQKQVISQKDWLYPYSLGEVYKRRGMQEKAIQEWEKVLAVDKSPDTYHMLSCSHFSLGNFSKAMEYAQSGYLQNTDYRPLLHKLILIQLLTGDNNDALNNANRFLIQKKDASAFYLRSFVKYVTGDLKGALEDTKEALKLANKDLSLLNHKAAILHSMEEFTEEKACLNEILSMKNHNYPPKNYNIYLAQTYARLHDFRKAESLIDESFNDDSTNDESISGDAYFMTAMTYSIMNNPKKAVEFLYIAYDKDAESIPLILIDPDFENIRINEDLKEFIRNKMPGLEYDKKFKNPLF